MKKSLFTAAMCAVFCIVMGAATICMAQAGMAVGGFREVSKTDSGAINAANFAVKTQAKKDASLKLVSVVRAERQIVAGSNFRLCLAVKSNDKPQQASATVYLNLQNVYSLTNWKIENCGGSGAEIDADREETSSEDESVTYAGTVELGKTGSAIVYLGEESGDLAAFCFTNNSEVGRAILAACKGGEKCEFTGKVDFEGGCKIKDERDLSASGKIVSIDSVKSLARKNSAAAKPSTAAGIAPDALVKKLYEVHKAGRGPFFQTESRAVIDQYFTKDFADLIWKDAITANGEVGAIEADPLFNAQDTKITAFTIGKPEYDTSGNSNVATVLVSFKNFGKSDTVSFQLEPDAAKNWKIMDIRYQNGDMLKGILFSSQVEEMTEFEGNYLVGTVKCTITPESGEGAGHQVKCADQKKIQVYFADNSSDQAIYVSENQKSRFVFDDKTLMKGKFINEAGKKVSVSKVQ